MKLKTLIVGCLLSVFLVGCDSEQPPLEGVYRNLETPGIYFFIEKQDGDYFAQWPFSRDPIYINKNSLPIIAAAHGLIRIDVIDENRVDLILEGRRYPYIREKKAGDPLAILFDNPEVINIAQLSQCDLDYSVQPLANAAPYPEKIDALVEAISQRQSPYQHVNSLLILKGDKLVSENYFRGWHRQLPHQVQSVSKSVTALLFGMAQKEGHFSDMDESIANYLPNYQAHFSGDKRNITLDHLLSMRAGLAWNETQLSYNDPQNDRSIESTSADGMDYTLSKPLQHAPGDAFYYNGGLVTITGEIIAKATEEDNVADYAKYGPMTELCLKNAYWMLQSDRYPNAAGGLFLRPIDMVKLGQLVRDDGQWQGQTLIQPSWIKQALSGKVDNALGELDYGYYWWKDSFIYQGQSYEIDLAWGWGEQHIAVVKALDLVVVQTAQNFQQAPSFETMLKEKILPAFIEQQVDDKH